jgi:hypothetical protein
MHPRITLSELLTATETSVEALKSMRRRDHVALAFGRRDALASSWYLPVDAVGIHLTTALAKVYGATLAAQMVRTFGDVLLTVVAQAEADFASDAHFAVVDFVNETDGRSAHLACGARDATPEAVAAMVARSPAAQGYVVARINVVNVSHVIRVIRTTAARHGIDLTARFLPAPDSDEFQGLMQPYAQQETGIVERSARRKREAIARRIGEQARARAMGGRISVGGRSARSRSLQAAEA